MLVHSNLSVLKNGRRPKQSEAFCYIVLHRPRQSSAAVKPKRLAHNWKSPWFPEDVTVWNFSKKEKGRTQHYYRKFSWQCKVTFYFKFIYDKRNSLPVGDVGLWFKWLLVGTMYDKVATFSFALLVDGGEGLRWENIMPTKKFVDLLVGLRLCSGAINNSG